jgi:hypothetical protein
MTNAGLLIVAAFVLGVVAIILSFTLRWQALVRKNSRHQSAVHLDAEMDGLQIFEAAAVASKESRRARVARQERIRKILIPVAFGLSGAPAIFALAALFLAGDSEAAIVCAMTATVGLGASAAAYFFAKHERHKAIHSGIQADQSL